jgi:hypothetical protein
MKTFGIIGSRKCPENEETFWIMRQSVRNIINSLMVPHEQYALVSGAAAYSDHLAVSLFNRGEARALTLHLPCEFDMGLGRFVGGQIANTANYWHEIFSDIIYRNGSKSLSEIKEAIETGAQITVSSGFFERNVLVARDSEYLIAFSESQNGKIKSKGTAHTMGLFLMKKDPRNSYHVDLHNFGLYQPAKT